MSRQIYKGAVDQSVVIRIVDSTDGTPETGVTSASGGLALEYRREGAASVGITESDLSTLADAHSDGGMLHIGNGYYRVDIPDAAFASGADGVLIHGVVTGMVVIGAYIDLIDPLAPQKGVAYADIPFKMVDSTDHVTPKTGLTVSAYVSKDGGSFAAASGSVSEIGNGVYAFDAAAADMNGDVLVFRFTGTNADDREVAIATRA